MAMYWTCKYGANHDLGEKCDCREAEEQQEAGRYPLMKERGTNQLVFNWQEEGGKSEKKAGCI